jgi:hypothetical protein
MVFMVQRIIGRYGIQIAVGQFVDVNGCGRLPHYALDKAAGRGFLGAVTQLLGNSMYVKIQNEDKMTALQCAASNSLTAIALLLWITALAMHRNLGLHPSGVRNTLFDNS